MINKPLSVLSIILISAATMLFTMACAEAASFDCTKSQTIVEKTICQDRSLSELDTQLGQIYTEITQSLSRRDVEEVKKEQLAWLKTRTSSCSGIDAICLQKVYAHRIESLKTHFSQMVEQSQSPSHEVEILNKKINVAFPPLEFKIFWKERKGASSSWQAPHGEISLIEIYSTKSLKCMQRLVKPDHNFSIFFEDYNFDGYLDFRLTLSGMILGNVFSDVYIFDPGRNRYFLHEKLSELTSISVDHDRKRLYSDNRSQRGASFTYKILTVVENKLFILLERTSDVQLVDGDIYLLISEKRFDKNARVISDRKKRIREDDLKDEHYPLETIPLERLP